MLLFNKLGTFSRDRLLKIELLGSMRVSATFEQYKFKCSFKTKKKNRLSNGTKIVNEL